MATMTITEKVAVNDPAAISIAGIVSKSWMSEGRMALIATPSAAAHTAVTRDVRRIEP